MNNSTTSSSSTGKETLTNYEMETEYPTKILTNGPYAYSRNPMYVGWTLLTLGISLVANSIWLLAFLILAVIFTHFIVIMREEQYLEEQFGEQYQNYYQKVRRYF